MFYLHFDFLKSCLFNFTEGTHSFVVYFSFKFYFYWLSLCNGDPNNMLAFSFFKRAASLLIADELGLPPILSILYIELWNVLVTKT